jgi:hypothetical protein
LIKCLPVSLGNGREVFSLRNLSKNMQRINILVLLLIIMIAFQSCKKFYDPSMGDLSINELMTYNKTTVTDQDGQFDDWIELYNFSSSGIDLSGYFLSDSKKNISKWTFPQGTSISGKGYLIIWADKDTTQLGLHANFKLSSTGETVILSQPDGALIEKVDYPAQTIELSYSRNPDGSGRFIWQRPTFNWTNNNVK